MAHVLGCRLNKKSKNKNDRITVKESPNGTPAVSVASLMRGSKTSNLLLSQKNGGCGDNARCNMSAPGVRSCTCSSNYVGDGFTCRGTVAKVSVPPHKDKTVNELMLMANDSTGAPEEEAARLLHQPDGSCCQPLLLPLEDK